MKILSLAIPSALLLTATAFAETLNVRPGLWSTTTTMTTGGAPFYIENMPASGRAEYAKSWAETVGKPTSDQDEDCITADDIKKTDLFNAMKDQAESCKLTATTQNATTMAGVIECKDAKTSTRTEINYIASSPTNIKGTMKSTITSPNGTTTMLLTMAAKWIAASCPADEDSDDDSDNESDDDKDGK